MSERGSPVGYALYFIDVLACLLFSIVLTLVGARFTSETTVPVDLPDLAQATGAAESPEALAVTVVEEDGRARLFLGEQPVSFAELSEAFRREAPPTVRIRAEETPLARVIGLAHESGIHDIELAYETRARARDGGP